MFLGCRPRQLSESLVQRRPYILRDLVLFERRVSKGLKGVIKRTPYSSRGIANRAIKIKYEEC